MRWVGIAFAFIVLAVTGCNGYSSGPDGEKTLTSDFYGIVEGLEAGNPFMRSVNLHLTEYLGTVSGSYTMIGGTVGSISGTVSGSSASLTFDQTNPCEGMFISTASFTGDRLTGSYSGNSCRGAVDANFEVNRQGQVVPLSRTGAAP